MIEVGDLVKRIALLSVMDNEFGWAMYDFPDDIGIVLAVEVATYEGLEDDFDTGSFIKVMWQNGDYDGPVWHWSEEISIITKINP
jgi:hypothetical protein|tara:strand:+ start:916 stop:1170 length:255 start_codon:yes stop_codon:yes gene_type:complete